MLVHSRRFTEILIVTILVHNTIFCDELHLFVLQFVVFLGKIKVFDISIKGHLIVMRLYKESFVQFDTDA